MIYRFDDQGHGEVFSEEREPDREAYLGNRYPASDIPQIARRLYERNRIRVLVDVDWRGALFDGSRALLEAVEATGAALLFEGEVRTVGDVPSTLALREIGHWLDAQPHGGVIATASLGQDAPQFELLTAIASGLLATPVSTSPGEYLIWLRPGARSHGDLGRQPVQAYPGRRRIRGSLDDLVPLRKRAPW